MGELVGPQPGAKQLDYWGAVEQPQEMPYVGAFGKRIDIPHLSQIRKQLAPLEHASVIMERISSALNNEVVNIDVFIAEPLAAAGDQ